MSTLARLVILWTLACVSIGSPAQAGRAWMTEDAMRGAFIGKTLDGYYEDGRDWTETYDPNGRLDYRKSARRSLGYWYLRDHVFCTLYDPGQPSYGGCFMAVQASANCYEFYPAGLSASEARKAPAPLGQWVARASRRGEPSTCPARPTV